MTLAFLAPADAAAYAHGLTATDPRFLYIVAEEAFPHGPTEYVVTAAPAETDRVVADVWPDGPVSWREPIEWDTPPRVPFQEARER